jgi:ABC-type transport system involved in cytochrome c biogenesis permease subunit
VSTLLQEPVLTGLALLFLAGSGVLAGWTLVAGRRGWLARGGAGVGSYLLILALTARGIRIQGWPCTSTYEAVLLTAAAIALLYAVGVPHHLSGPGGVCAGVSTTLLVGLTLLFVPAAARTPQPPPAAFSGPLFPLHVLCMALGYGGLLLAGCAGLWRLAAGRGAGEHSFRPGRRVVRPADLEALAWRGLAWGYPCLTLGMAVGAAWGWTVWGWYWGWSIKEVLTLLTWGLFTMAVHARRLQGWRGRPYAAVLAAGLVALLVTLLAAGALARGGNPTVQYVF